MTKLRTGCLSICTRNVLAWKAGMRFVLGLYSGRGLWHHDGYEGRLPERLRHLLPFALCVMAYRNALGKVQIQGRSSGMPAITQTLNFC